MNEYKKPPVVIFCGGAGTRIREETEFRPKPMINVGGEPILWHLMKIYASYGLDRFILCLGYKGEVIRDYFLGYRARRASALTVPLAKGNVEIHGAGAAEDWEVTLVDTGLNTLTSARLKQVEPYIDTDHFFCTYGDGLASIDIRRLEDFHRSHGLIATVTGVHPPGRFGEMDLEGDIVRRFVEKPVRTDQFINGGFFVFNREIFSYLSDDALEGRPLSMLVEERQLAVYRHEGFWQCMDTIADRDRLERLASSGNAPWMMPMGRAADKEMLA